MNKKSKIIGIIFIFLLGSALHFTYELSGNNILVGFFSAINESVWEHTKLFILPVVLWYVIYYYKTKKSLDKNSWFSSMVVTLLVSIVLVPLLYYFYVGIIGKSILFIDILIFLISDIVGVLLGGIFYNKNKTLPWRTILSIIIVVYIIFTIFTPNLPIFISN